MTITGVVGEGPVTRAELTAQRIADRARGAAPGARLGTKKELRELCGVSVGTFNEALRLLQSRGVVAVRPGPRGGLFVAEQSPMVTSVRRCRPMVVSPVRLRRRRAGGASRRCPR